MMGVYIKGMNKPIECYCCPCSTINMNGRWGKCNLLGRDYAGGPHKIYNDCPLVEIPPHGRLIDADKLEIERRTYETYNDYSEVFDMIDNVPTVIESEEE